MNRKNQSFTMGLGIPTVLIIFVSLAMCIMTLLSYINVKSNDEVVKRELEYTKAYYHAKAKADYEFKQNKDIIIVKINDNQELILTKDDNGIAHYQVLGK